MLSRGAEAGTLETIRAKGIVTCGVAAEASVLSGVATDGKGTLAAALCHIMAAATLGRAEAVSLIPLSEEEAYAALQAEDVDVLLMPLAWRLTDEVEQGVVLVLPLYRQGEGGRRFGPVVRQGDDAWFVALRWILMTLLAKPETVVSPAHEAAGVSLGFAAGWVKAVRGFGDYLSGPAAAALSDEKWAAEPLPAANLE